jgi:hypothetical protein
MGDDGPTRKKSISIVDFYIPAIPKVPIVFGTQIIPLLAVAFGGRYLLDLILSRYGDIWALAILIFSLLYACHMAIALGSRWFYMKLWKDKKRIDHVNRLPHPIVQNIPRLSRHRQRQVNFAIMVMESKMWAMAWGVAAIFLHSLTCVFIYWRYPSYINTSGAVDTIVYSLTHVLSGIVLDFFTEFNISLSSASPETWVNALTFLIKLFVTYIVVKAFVDYYGYRRRYWYLMRDEALTYKNAMSLMK